nr:MAG TPA: hypothetical protein [Caudoviricetes sp.]
MCQDLLCCYKIFVIIVRILRRRSIRLILLGLMEYQRHLIAFAVRTENAAPGLLRI